MANSANLLVPRPCPPPLPFFFSHSFPFFPGSYSSGTIRICSFFELHPTQGYSYQPGFFICVPFLCPAVRFRLDLQEQEPAEAARVKANNCASSKQTLDIMTRHMLNHMNYPADQPIDYRPSRDPPQERPMGLPLARQNLRADPMTRQSSRAGSTSQVHATTNNVGGSPRRRIPVAVRSSLTLLFNNLSQIA